MELGTPQSRNGHPIILEKPVVEILDLYGLMTPLSKKKKTLLKKNMVLGVSKHFFFSKFIIVMWIKKKIGLGFITSGNIFLLKVFQQQINAFHA